MWSARERGGLRPKTPQRPSSAPHRAGSDPGIEASLLETNARSSGEERAACAANPGVGTFNPTRALLPARRGSVRAKKKPTPNAKKPTPKAKKNAMGKKDLFCLWSFFFALGVAAGFLEARGRTAALEASNLGGQYPGSESKGFSYYGDV